MEQYIEPKVVYEEPFPIGLEFKSILKSNYFFLSISQVNRNIYIKKYETNNTIKWTRNDQTL